ncbi:MAG: FAD-dependent oxidoreductase [Microthrixaceae bacterium]
MQDSSGGSTDATQRLAEGMPLPEPGSFEQLQRVVVVGAGPVGMCTALALGRAGVPVTVMEKGPGLATESRASTFHPPTSSCWRTWVLSMR